jgi:hypothetical protein
VTAAKIVAENDATQPGGLTTVEKLRGLPWSISANVANTIFVQFTFFGSVFPLFLSELGLSKSQRKSRLYRQNAFEVLVARFGLIDPSKYTYSPVRL